MTTTRLALSLALVVVVLSFAPTPPPPHFTLEPPARLLLSPVSPAHVVSCMASPVDARVTWLYLTSDNHWIPVLNNASSGAHRFVRPLDNALVLSAPTEDAIPGQSVYRCVATNHWGSVASRNVVVRTVLFNAFQINVFDQHVIRGSIAVFRCQMPALVRPFLVVNAWIRDDGHQMSGSFETGAKHFVFDGDLYIVQVLTTSGHSFKCAVRNTVTGTDHWSVTSGKLFITDPVASIAPRVRVAAKEVVVDAGQDVVLACVAQAYPAPQYRWLNSEGKVVSESEPIVRLTAVDARARGLYTCSANNSAGRDQMDTRLVVREAIAVEVRVGGARVEAGKDVRINCSVKGWPIESITWTKDALPLVTSHRIKVVNNAVVIAGAQKSDIGCYSCRVNDNSATTDSAVASKCLHLVEDVPHFRQTFRQHILRPNERLSLRCVASGSPIPAIAWSVDGLPIADSHRIQIGDYVSTSGDVISSFVNISHVRVDDSGLYECFAQNTAGAVSHRETVRVLGALFMRSMANVSAVDGNQLSIRCPVAQTEVNEPKIKWTRGVKEVSLVSERHKAFPNGTLFIRDLNREADTGTYTCRAVSRAGETAEQKVVILVLKKPILSTLAFPTALTSGMRVVVTCSVLDGDRPLRLQWLLDGHEMETRALEDMEEISMADMGSSLLFRRVARHHSGLYTCLARNAAGNTSVSAQMVVRVPPLWTIIPPNDRSVVIGEHVLFDCQADGFPFPVIRWKVKTGEESEFRPLSSNSHIQSLENGSLAIKDVAKDDSGLYVCEAGNGVGVDISVVVRLRVNVGAHFRRPLQLIRVLKGDAIRVECEAFGEKPLTLKWTTRDGQDIDLNNKYTVSERQTSDGLISELLITAFAQRSDSTQLTCVAVNAFGQSVMTSQVVVEEAPDPPSALTTVDTKSRSVSLKWEQPFDGNNAIIKYEIQWKETKDQWTAKTTEVLSKTETQAVVAELRPLTSYEMRVRAHNSVGESVWSEVSVRTEAEMPKSAPQEIRVIALSSRSLQITWRSPANDSAEHIRGYYIGCRDVGESSGQRESETTFKTIEFTHSRDMEYVLSGLRVSHTYAITVQAFNSKGAGPQSPEVQSQTRAYDAPNAPNLRLIVDTEDRLEWTTDDDKENPILGFRVFGRRILRAQDMEWKEYGLLDASQRALRLPQLSCGSNYQFYCVAFNDVGVSSASQMVSRDLTSTGVGVYPDHNALLSVNATHVSVHLRAWPKGGVCAVNHFRIQYKPFDRKEWSLVSSDTQTEQTLTIGGLIPGLWYNLMVSALYTPDGGVSSDDVQYLFSTLTTDGATIAPLTASSPSVTHEDERRITKYFIVLIPIACASAVLCVVVVFVCLHRRTATEVDMEVERDMKRDSVSITALSMCQMDGKWMAAEDMSPSLLFPIPYATSQLFSDTCSDARQHAYHHLLKKKTSGQEDDDDLTTREEHSSRALHSRHCCH